MDRSIAFYRDTLGLTLDKNFSLADLNLNIALLHVGGCVIELVQHASVPSQPGPVDHICFSVEDIDTLVENLRAKGVPFLSDRAGVLTGELAGIKYIFLTGPDGERIEFFDTSGQ